MPAPRHKEPEMASLTSSELVYPAASGRTETATAEPSPAPRLKCSNEQCEYLASLDTEKMGTFCCKKCHLHFCGGARKLKHGDLCKREVAPPEVVERAKTVVEPKQPMDSQVTYSSKPAKKKWNEQSNGRYTWNEPVDEKLDGIWKMTEEDRQHALLQQKNQILKMKLTLRNPQRQEESPMTDASSSKTTDREENGRDTIRRQSRPRAPHSESALQHHGSGNPIRSTGSRSHRDVTDKRHRPRPDSFPMTYPDELEDGECSPSRPRERSRSPWKTKSVVHGPFPRGTVGRQLRASRSHQDLGTEPDQRHERRERIRRRRQDPRPTLPVHPESLPRSYPRDDHGEREAARRADSHSPSPKYHAPSGRATASRHHTRSFVIYHARVGSETESEDSDWTVKTSYTVLRDEVPAPKPCERWQRAEEGSRKSTEMRRSAMGQSDAPEALGLRQLPPREPASVEHRHSRDRKETLDRSGGLGRSRSRDRPVASRGGPGRGRSDTRRLQESRRPSPERYGSDHPRDGRHKATDCAGDTQRRRSQERFPRTRFDVFAKERPLNDGNHREPGRNEREFSSNMKGTRSVDREPDSRARSHRITGPGNSARAREASRESNYSYYSDCYYSSSEDPPTRPRTEVQQKERRRSGDRRGSEPRSRRTS